MNCNQCEQSIEGGCTTIGTCGKNEDIASLQDTIIYGLKGLSAYAHHAKELDYEDPAVNAFVHEALFYTLTNTNFNLEQNLLMALKVGEKTLKVLDMLDRAHMEILGIPSPVEVKQNEVKGKAILVTGHDYFALKMLLEQSEGKGVNIYTHSEMLPAHSYPELNKFKHLKGNVGGAWHDQRQVFEEFPGAILVTTNCIMPTTQDYSKRMYTYGPVGLDGVEKIKNNDFSQLIEKALSLPEANTDSDKKLTTGFHHSTILDLAPKLIEAIKAGKIKRFFVIAGCDAPEDTRSYFRELAEAVPKDCIILTSACGKFRFNDIDFGDIDGIPRFLDLGQCNNSISAVHVATALAQAFDCSVNDLPLTIVLSWYEQKAVAILLGLLSLNVENIFIGPKAPEFLSKGVVKVLQDKYKLNLTSTVEQDLPKMLN